MTTFVVDPDAWRAPEEVAAAMAADLPEAILCYDDKLALGLMDALRALGIRVPDDVGLVGFDGIPFTAISNPRLTTVTTPTRDLGRLAAAALIGVAQTGRRPAGVLLQAGAGRPGEHAQARLAAGPRHARAGRAGGRAARNEHGLTRRRHAC